MYGLVGNARWVKSTRRMLCVILCTVDVTTTIITKIPAGNLCIPRDTFAEHWRHAEQLNQPGGPHTDYLVGVVRTCRWLADQPFWSGIDNRMMPPPAPITGRHRADSPEAIEAEYTAALRCTASHRREIARGVIATLDWCWNGTNQPPFQHQESGDLNQTSVCHAPSASVS